jgi:hypothetical protein
VGRPFISPQHISGHSIEARQRILETFYRATATGRDRNFGYIKMARRLYGLMAARKNWSHHQHLGAAEENPDFDYIAGCSGNASLMAFTRAMGRHGIAQRAARHGHQSRRS